MFVGQWKMDLCLVLPFEDIAVILGNDISCMCLLTIIRLWFLYRPVAGVPDANEEKFPVPVFKACVVTCPMNRASKDAGPSRAEENRWCFPV